MKKQTEHTIPISDDDSINFSYSESDGIMYVTIFNAEKSCDLKISLNRGIDLGYDMVNIFRQMKKDHETLT